MNCSPFAMTFNKFTYMVTYSTANELIRPVDLFDNLQLGNYMQSLDCLVLKSNVILGPICFKKSNFELNLST